MWLKGLDRHIIILKALKASIFYKRRTLLKNKCREDYFQIDNIRLKMGHTLGKW